MAGRCQGPPGRRGGRCRVRAERPGWCRAAGGSCLPGTAEAAAPAAAAAAQGRRQPGRQAGCRPGTAGLAVRGFAAGCSLLERQRETWGERAQNQGRSQKDLFLLTLTNTKQRGKHR